MHISTVSISDLRSTALRAAVFAMLLVTMLVALGGMAFASPEIGV